MRQAILLVGATQIFKRVVREKGMSGLRICAERWKTRAKHLPDLILDLIRVTRAIDQDNAIWLTRAKVAICLANALVKLLGFLLHPILSTRFLHS